MNKIPSQIILEFINNPRFVTVLDRCLEEEDLIEQFERLYGVKRPAERQHPLERMVDEVTGFRKSQWSDFFEAFIPFIYDCVWLRWEGRNDERCWK